MKKTDRKDIASQLKRYLSFRRSVWGDIAFRINRQSGRAPESKAGVEYSANDSKRANVSVPESANVTEGSEGKGISMELDDEYGKRLQGKSVRYRTPASSAEQESLFDDSTTHEEVLDLSGEDLGSLEKKLAECKRCHLWEKRTRTVFGSGSKKAKLMFVGEAPGRQEDLQGLPFVGRAGELLTKILDSVGLTRDEVYITNILKCRPPNNRDPNEEEVKACEPYLQRQIELLQPLLICALGRVAAQNLLKTNASLSVLRGGIHYYNDTMVIVTYHPAALLRNPHLKRGAWEDIKMVRKIYDKELEGEG